MSGRARTFRTATTAPTAGAPESVSAAPDPRPESSGRAEGYEPQGAQTGAVPGPVSRVPRPAGASLPEHARRDWRHRLRSSAGRLARAYEAAASAEDAWDALADEARRAGVPPGMLTAALEDARVPT